MTVPPLFIRALGLLAPLAAAWCLWAWRRPRGRQFAAVLLACVWNVPALLAVQALAARFGWWRFEARGGLVGGVPFDLFVGWALLWGAIPFLAFPHARLALVVALFACVDLLLMPLCAPVVVLGRYWLVGEAAAISLCLIPAQLLARWTLLDRRLAWRATLQMLAFAGLLFAFLPTVILGLTGGGWSVLARRPAYLNSLALQLLAAPAVLGLSALQEFVTRGRGTPLPYDPPRRLVASGVYAYVSNPMQLATCLLFVGLGALLGSPWVAAAALVALAYGAGLAAWDEGGDLRERFGDDWTNYRRAVRAWWPRWRPFRAASATVYVAESCGMCGEVGRWLAAREPTALSVIAAEDHPARELRRMTYETLEGGETEEGVAAFARALEHINFAWALAGAAMRLPPARQFLQLLVDASGGEPRAVRRRGSVTCPNAGSRS